MTAMNTIFFLLTIWTNFPVSLGEQAVSPRIEQYLNSQIHDNGFSGEVLVGQGDGLLVKKNVLAPVKGGNEVNEPAERLPIESIGEQFMAVALLQLETSGRISLDDPLCKYLPDCPVGWNNIHVLHLLSHSSGLPDLVDFPPCVKAAATVSGSSATIAGISRSPLLFKPGTSFNANKFDYYFVSLLIERISGQSTSTYLKQHIFLPLKLVHTGYAPRGSHLQSSPNVSRTKSCPQGQSDPNPIPVYFADEIFTTVADLYVWDKALITDQFLSKRALDKMFNPYVEGHGFGWKIVKEFDRMAVVQNDDFGDTSISSRIYPDDGTCILVVSRTHGTPATSVSHDLGAILFGKHYPASSRSGPTPTPR